LVGSMLLLTGTVSVVITITPLLVGSMLLLTGTVVVIAPTVCRGLDAVYSRNTTYFMLHETKQKTQVRKCQGA